VGAPNHFGGDRITAETKSPDNVTSTFFNRVYLLPKDLSFEHGGTKLASCPGPHITSLRPCESTNVAVAFYMLQYGLIRVISSIEKLIHLPWCCNTKVQTYCGLTDCTDSTPETGFSSCRLLKSCFSPKFSMLIAFLSSLLLFRSKLPPSIKKELVTKTGQSCTAQRQVQKLY